MTDTAKKNETSSMANLAGKYLAFALAGEKYALDILKVQEIIGVSHFTAIPRSPDYMKGVINLRGKVIPVVDLRLKFSIPAMEYNEKTCIIVVDVKIAGKQMLVGIVVDTVLEVLKFQGEDIQPAPEYGADVNTKFLLGMGRTHDGNIIILIDIERALSDADVRIPEGLTA